MIANQREYRITAAAIRRLEEGLERADEHGAERPPLAQQLLREGIEGQLATLREQVAEYEALRSGTVAVLEADSLTQLPDALIRARIASGLTQRALAERLGLKEQQVQRYEATQYAGVLSEDFGSDEPSKVIPRGHVEHNALRQLVAQGGRQQDVGVDQHIHGPAR